MANFHAGDIRRSGAKPHSGRPGGGGSLKATGPIKPRRRCGGRPAPHGSIGQAGSYALHLRRATTRGAGLDETICTAAEARHGAYYPAVAQRSEKERPTAEAALPQIRAAWRRAGAGRRRWLIRLAAAAKEFFRRRGLLDHQHHLATEARRRRRRPANGALPAGVTMVGLHSP